MLSSTACLPSERVHVQDNGSVQVQVNVNVSFSDSGAVI